MLLWSFLLMCAEPNKRLTDTLLYVHEAVVSPVLFCCVTPVSGWNWIAPGSDGDLDTKVFQCWRKSVDVILQSRIIRRRCLVPRV